MQELSSSILMGDFAKILTAAMPEPAAGTRFPCRPLVARTAERNTSLGRFTGQIGLGCVPEFREALHDLAAEDPSKVILDFAEVSLTKSAVGALVAFAAAMHGRNKRLYIYRPSEQVRAVLDELNLKPFFSTLETEDDVISTLVV